MNPLFLRIQYLRGFRRADNFDSFFLRLTTSQILASSISLCYMSTETHYQYHYLFPIVLAITLKEYLDTPFWKLQKLHYFTKSLIQSSPRAIGGSYWECRMLHRVSIELRMRLGMAILLVEI